MTSSVRLCLIYIYIQNVCTLSTIFMVKKNQDTFLASKSYMHFDPRISETKSLKKETTSIPARKKKKHVVSWDFDLSLTEFYLRRGGDLPIPCGELEHLGSLEHSGQRPWTKPSKV